MIGNGAVIQARTGLIKNKGVGAGSADNKPYMAGIRFCGFIYQNIQADAVTAGAVLFQQGIDVVGWGIPRFLMLRQY